MKFLLDKNIEHEVYYRLDRYGHRLLHVEISDEPYQEVTDEELAVYTGQVGSEGVPFTQ